MKNILLIPFALLALVFLFVFAFWPEGNPFSKSKNLELIND